MILADAFGDERQLGVEHHRHLADDGRKTVVASLGEDDGRAAKRLFAADGHARPCAQPAETTDRVSDGRSHPIREGVSVRARVFLGAGVPGARGTSRRAVRFPRP